MAEPVKAVVVGVQTPDVTDETFASSLAELERLADTLGLKPIGRVTQKRQAVAAQAVVGEGKLRELAEWTGGQGFVPRYRAPGRPDDDPIAEVEEQEDPRARVILVDHELSPTQIRNLERATEAEVLDRTSIILSIFQRHARTREAKLQVEIAHLTYLAPRLRETGASQERQRGGIGGKGAGESALELDRRKVRDRIAALRKEIAALTRDTQTQRQRRKETPTVALVGYTNAGKSSWMRALTANDLLVADRLFATLDTTVRVLLPETRPRVLVSDTVGFIKKLPHDLVASFRSTLDEAKNAQLQIHVVDAADAAFRDQLAVTREVLAEIGADEGDNLLVLNKADLLDGEQRAALAEEFPEAVLLSAKSKSDLGRLHGLIVDYFEQDMVEETLFVPYTEQRRVHDIHETCRVLEEKHDEEGTHVRVRATMVDLDRLLGRKPASQDDEDW